jgi:hypothetical protein
LTGTFESRADAIVRIKDRVEAEKRLARSADAAFDQIGQSRAMAGRVLGFGYAGLLVSTATDLLIALGVPLPGLDPTNLIDITTLGDPWRPQEVGVFNMVMAFKGELDAATRNLVKDLGWMVEATDWCDSAARFLFEDAPVTVGVPGRVVRSHAERLAGGRAGVGGDRAPYRDHRPAGNWQEPNRHGRSCRGMAPGRDGTPVVDEQHPGRRCDRHEDGTRG